MRSKLHKESAYNHWHIPDKSLTMAVARNAQFHEHQCLCNLWLLKNSNSFKACTWFNRKAPRVAWLHGIDGSSVWQDWLCLCSTQYCARLQYMQCIQMHPGPCHSALLLSYLALSFPHYSCSLESVRLQSNLSSVHQNPEHHDISKPAARETASFSIISAIKTYQDTRLACGLWSRRTFVHSSSRPHWLTNLIWMNRECKFAKQLGWRMMNDA